MLSLLYQLEHSVSLHILIFIINMIHAYTKKFKKERWGIEEHLFLSPPSLSLTQRMPFLCQSLSVSTISYAHTLAF